MPGLYLLDKLSLLGMPNDVRIFSFNYFVLFHPELFLYDHKHCTKYNVSE
jgi:hypothetical protein